MLEKELQTRLFDRTNRGVSLTAAGVVFKEEMKAVLARLERGKVLTRHAGQGLAGTWKLRVTDKFEGDFGYIDSWSLTV